MENEDAPPAYALRILPVALRAITAAYVYVADTSGKDDEKAYADEFRRGFFAALRPLAVFPFRHPVAPEADVMPPPSVRAMPYRYGSVVWRILHRVREADNNEAARVEIVALRHGAQKPLTQAEGRDIDAASR